MRRSDARLMSAWEFSPPPGWIVRAQSRGPFGMAADTQRTLLAAARTGLQIVSLQVLPAPRPRALRSILDPYFTTYSSLTLCRGLPALLGETRLPFGVTVSDEVAAEQNGTIVVASYHYGRAVAPDPAAETSIRSLCPARGP